MIGFSKKTSSLSINERRAARERFQKLMTSLFVLTASICFAQACGQFNSSLQDANLSSSDQNGNGGLSDPNADNGTNVSVNNPNGLQVILSSATLGTSQIMNFNFSGPSFGTNASVTWSHAMKDSSGSPIASCSEINGYNSFPYQLNCPIAGLLTVTMTVFENGGVTGPISHTFTVTTGTPAPTATPTQPNAAGVALYSTNCSGCHRSLNSTNIGVTSVAGITSSLKSVGAMRGLNLTATQIQQISDALNGK